MPKPVTNDEPLRIIYLEAENVKRLKAVRIRPDKTLVRIEGRNAQGKSSLIDSAIATLGGGSWQPEKPVRDGESKARTRIYLGDDSTTDREKSPYIVERYWTARGTTGLKLIVDGKEPGSPQKILDALVSEAFDPFAFQRMKPKEQADALRRLAGLDFGAMDAERKQLYDDRTVANRAAKSAETRRGSMPPKPKSEAPIDVRELAEKQQAAIAHNRNVENAQDAAARTASELAQAQDALKAAQLRMDEAETQAKATAKAAESMAEQDVGDLGAEIAAAESHNQAIKDRSEWEKRSAEAKGLAKQADEYDAKIQAIDDKKAHMLRDTEFPLEGLSLDATGVTLNGIPFSQASSAEQLRAGVAIGLSGKKRVRVAFVRDGSLLDSDNLQLLHDIAVEFDAQVFVERVAESADPSAVYIEDGEIVNAD